MGLLYRNEKLGHILFVAGAIAELQREIVVGRNSHRLQTKGAAPHRHRILGGRVSGRELGWAGRVDGAGRVEKAGTVDGAGRLAQLIFFVPLPTFESLH